MSRHFERDFTTDLLTLSPGGAAGFDGGPLSIAVVFRLDQVGSDQVLVRARTAGGAMVWDVLVSAGQLFFETTAGFRSCVAGLAADTWYLYAVTKPNGSGQVRDHLCVMATDTWTHADRGTPLGDGTGPVDHIRMSDGSGSGRVDGYIAAAGLFGVVLDDAAVEALRPGLAAWVAASAAALWRLNDTPVDDLTAGGADQTAIDGTTVDTGVEPPGFSYDVDEEDDAMNLANVMNAVGARLATITGLRVHSYPPAKVAPPAAVVSYPDDITYDATYMRGVDRMTLPVVLLVGKLSDRAARDQLGAYVDGSGDRSVKQVLDSGTYVGFAVRVTTAEFDLVTIGGVDYLAATFSLDIAGAGS